MVGVASPVAPVSGVSRPVRSPPFFFGRCVAIGFRRGLENFGNPRDLLCESRCLPLFPPCCSFLFVERCCSPVDICRGKALRAREYERQPYAAAKVQEQGAWHVVVVFVERSAAVAAAAPAHGWR